MTHNFSSSYLASSALINLVSSRSGFLSSAKTRCSTVPAQRQNRKKHWLVHSMQESETCAAGGDQSRGEVAYILYKI